MNKTVLITGASHGIGAACAKRFAEEHCDLILTCLHDQDTLDALTSELVDTYDIRCTTFVGDVGSEADVHRLFELILRRHTTLDIMILNAGIAHISLLQDMSVEEWHHVIDTNLTSAFLCIRSAIPLMLTQQRGSILAVSSVWGESGASCEAAYSASKGGLNSLVKAMSKELAPSGIRVNAVSCGVIDTRMNNQLSPNEKRDLTSEIPLGRFGTPAEAADCIYIIAATQDYMTGQIVTLDGGFVS